MNDPTKPLPETFVERVERELRAFFELWRRRKIIAAVVVVVGLVIGYPYVEKIWRPNPITTTEANDPDRTIIVKTFLHDPATKTDSYLYFLKAEGDTWFEVNSDPSKYDRFMFRLKSIDKNMITLFDGTRNVELVLDFENRVVWYHQPGISDRRKLYDIVRISVAGK
ncbi:MAG: hypothetical protein Q7U64_11930 [Desulfocapsaceae bacterium]|jgi:hypothetical protein|nr:hypothetical protein [Desulfocapsaceae bacterium]